MDKVGIQKSDQDSSDTKFAMVIDELVWGLLFYFRCNIPVFTNPLNNHYQKLNLIFF